MYGGIVGPPAVAGGVLAFTGFETGGYVLTALALVVAGALFLRYKTIRAEAGCHRRGLRPSLACPSDPDIVREPACHTP